MFSILLAMLYLHTFQTFSNAFDFISLKYLEDFYTGYKHSSTAPRFSAQVGLANEPVLGAHGKFTHSSHME